MKKNSTIWGQSALAMGFTWLAIQLTTGYIVPALSIGAIIAGLAYIVAKMRGE